MVTPASPWLLWDGWGVPRGDLRVQQPAGSLLEGLALPTAAHMRPEGAGPAGAGFGLHAAINSIEKRVGLLLLCPRHL